MRKKTILGSYVNNEGVLYTYLIKKLNMKLEGYSALINFLPNTKELFVDDGNEKLCLSGSGYKWLMYLPMVEKWCITAFYSPQDELLEWYFDISRNNFIDEDGMPCMDDVFLDLAIMPDGNSITLDEDELLEALNRKEICTDDYNNAYKTRDGILNSKWSEVSFLKDISNELISDYKNLR